MKALRPGLASNVSIASQVLQCYRRSGERTRNTALPLIDCQRHLRDLNPAQRSVVEYGIGGDTKSPPALLIAAGAGTGKTMTLAHRVAHLILNGADPHRLLLLTFTRRAALEMTRRTHQILAEARGDGVDRASPQTPVLPWSGTFHSVGSRLLRLHALSIGLDASFTILDRSDSADLLDLVRTELGLSRTASRFPRKDTCLAIYSYTVNAGCPLEETLAQSFPWCADWPNELRRLFEAYVVAKQRDNVLDYDDLLLYWRHAMAEPAVAMEIRGCFDHVLVDEYQDTNRLQAEILLALRPDGSGLTIVGDDAQSIYSFRAATVRNILDFPTISPPACVASTQLRSAHVPGCGRLSRFGRIAGPAAFGALFTIPARGRTTVAPFPAPRRTPARSLPHRSGRRNARRLAGRLPSNAAARSSPACLPRYAVASPTDIPSHAR